MLRKYQGRAAVDARVNVTDNEGGLGRQVTASGVAIMSALDALPPALDLLIEAIDLARQYLGREKQITTRVKIFWAAVVASQPLGAADVVRDEFFNLAVASGLFGELERVPPYAAGETIEHLIRWGLLRRNPFGRLR
jgi:hypothetical protein